MLIGIFGKETAVFGKGPCVFPSIPIIDTHTAFWVSIPKSCRLIRKFLSLRSYAANINLEASSKWYYEYMAV